MNYPLQSLAIIAPIVFLVLMIGLPIIGVFAGWKRAAYWGGGTFFFFLIGALVWTFAGTVISAKLVDLLNNLLKDLGVTATQKLVASLAAPVFFLAVMLIAELLLLINYYAWFKKVAKIKQDIQAKKEYKAAVKAKKEAGKSADTVKVPKGAQGWTAMQFTTKGKAINMAVGGAGMALLLAPSTITFTQAILYTTTSASTRANNAFCAGLYNSLAKTATAFSWMSYYGNNDTAKDFDSLFSTLALSQQKISYVDPTTGETTGEEKTVIEAVGDSAANGIKNIVSVATDDVQSKDPQTQMDGIEEAVDSFAKSWNNIIEQAGTDVTAVFQSENVTEMFESVIPQIIGDGGISVDVEQVVEAYGDDSVFKNILEQVKDGYQQEGETIHVEYKTESGETVSGDLTKLQSIPVSQQAFDNIKESFKNSINTSAIDDDPDASKTFDNALGDILSMLFYVA